MIDQDYVEGSREYSSDSSMLLVRYSIDLGAFGYGQAGTAVLHISDTTKNLRLFTLPNTLTRVTWLDNKTLAAKKDIIPSVRMGKVPEVEDTVINGIKVNVSELDYIEPEYHLEVEHRETSPNGEFDLIAYRYLKNRSNLNFIHVSVVPKGSKIPKYGNYFIADMMSDYILYGTWNKNNELLFYSNSQYSDMIQYFLVKDRPSINHRIVEDNERYSNKYRWTEKSGL